MDNLTSAQKRFMDNFAAEVKAISTFKNASGVPLEAVADPDGQGQVGWEVQVDDQFTPDVSLRLLLSRSLETAISRRYASIYCVRC